MVEGYQGERPDVLREKCGVWGIYAPGLPVAELTYEAMQIQQNRGQEAAGMVISYGVDDRMLALGGLGSVQRVFRQGSSVRGLSEGAVAANGQTRYGTAETPEGSEFDAAQPLLFSRGKLDPYAFALGHNGNIESFVGKDASDTVHLQELIADSYLRSGNLTSALKGVLPTAEDGAFSLVLTTPDKLIGGRDTRGFRPLHLGKIPRGRGWVLASEMAAIEMVDAVEVREVKPGEIITITGPGARDIKSTTFGEKRPAICSMEFVYFSRPDNEMNGELVAFARLRMGRALGKRILSAGIEADMILGSPESGIFSADGASRETGIPHEHFLMRNRHVDRSFIAPNQDLRVRMVRNKLNPIRRGIEGKRVIVIDDSIVRGTTQRELVRMLRERGAAKVHVAISAPPILWPCFHGMDTGRRGELIAYKKRGNIEAIRKHIDSDTLIYNEIEDLHESLGDAGGDSACDACFTGKYATKLPDSALSKL